MGSIQTAEWEWGLLFQQISPMISHRSRGYADEARSHLLRNVATFILQAILGLLMAFAAYSLFARTPDFIAQQRDALNYPSWYWLLAGVMATISAIALLVGLFNATIGGFAALWTVAYFIIAALTHASRTDWANIAPPIICLLLAVLLLWLRWDDAKAIRARVGMA
jgi:uncharacterized membrane protein YphA (DoxX/SURF4 family)